MQVSVEAISELNRKMTVQVPEEQIRERIESRLRSLSREVQLDGFRPGKAPASLIRKRFGARVREEVLADMIQSSFYEAVRDERLKPAGAPVITTTEFAEGSGLSYIADFEILPEFALSPLETLECTRFISLVSEDDLAAMIARLREQRRRWVAVARPVAPGDQITINFEGKVDGESFTDGRVEGLRFVLGSGQVIPGFEEHLTGAAPGAELNFEVQFPADYGNEKLAGKTGSFQVEVSRVEESVLPELDAEFVATFGIENGDMEAFRRDVRENMEREMRRALKNRTKTTVLDALLARHSFPLPEVLVQEELKDLLQPYQKAMEKGNLEVTLETLKERYLPLARRRVALGLLLNRLIEDHRLTVDRKRVRETIEELARGYEHPQQVVDWYYSDRSHLREIENLVLEDQVIDLILAKARVIEREVPFSELMQPAAAIDRQPETGESE
jgi:trigger factor